jgi:hypothetical protein
MLRRIFEKVLHPMLVYYAASQIHPAQSGFTQFDSTLPPLRFTDRSHRGYRLLHGAMFALNSLLFHVLSKVPSTQNGRDCVLHPALGPETQRHPVFWRKGIFALNKQ